MSSTSITSISGITRIFVSMIVGASIAGIAGCASDPEPRSARPISYEVYCKRNGGVTWNGRCIPEREAEERLRHMRDRWGG